MKKLKAFSICLCLVMACMLLFSGCTSLNLNHLNLAKFEQPTTTNEVLNINTEGLTAQEKKTAIAEAYINISFTVSISEETKKQVFDKNMNLISTDTTKKHNSHGSGVVVHTGGYIVTNYHVVKKVLQAPEESTQKNNLTGETTKTIKSYTVSVSQDGGETSYDATILWSVVNFDLAILYCADFAHLPAAPMMDRSVYCAEEDRVNVLEEVITIGTQYDRENYSTATVGTISSDINRTIWGGELQVNYEYLIQHDAPINHGNSGGPIVDLNGNLIGINTLGIDAANLLFYSVSIYPIISVIDTVVENWEQMGQGTSEVAFGVSALDKYLVQNTDNLSNHNQIVPKEFQTFNKNGVIVIENPENSIIKGISKNDLITKITFNGANTTEVIIINNTYDFLYARIKLHNYSSATVTVVRDGVETELQLIKE